MNLRERFRLEEEENNKLLNKPVDTSEKIKEVADDEKAQETKFKHLDFLNNTEKDSSINVTSS